MRRLAPRGADWALLQLTGRFVTDRSLASRTNLFHLDVLEWEAEMLALCEVPRSMLCDVVPPASIVGGLVPGVARATGLAAGLPVVSAGGDQQCAALGLGLLSHSHAVANAGTGGFVIGHAAAVARAITKVSARRPSSAVRSAVSASAHQGGVSVASGTSSGSSTSDSGGCRACRCRCCSGASSWLALAIFAWPRWGLTAAPAGASILFTQPGVLLIGRAATADALLDFWITLAALDPWRDVEASTAGDRPDRAAARPAWAGVCEVPVRLALRVAYGAFGGTGPGSTRRGAWSSPSQVARKPGISPEALPERVPSAHGVFLRRVGGRRPVLQVDGLGVHQGSRCRRPSRCAARVAHPGESLLAETPA